MPADRPASDLDVALSALEDEEQWSAAMDRAKQWHTAVNEAKQWLRPRLAGIVETLLAPEPPDPREDLVVAKYISPHLKRALADALIRAASETEAGR